MYIHIIKRGVKFSPTSPWTAPESWAQKRRPSRQSDRLNYLIKDVGLITKRPNPNDGRSALLSLTPAGRLKIERLIGEIRTVNDLFFGLLEAQPFAELCANAGALVRGSREAMKYIERVEEGSE